MVEMANQRKAFGKTLVELGRKYPQIVALNADLSSSTLTDMFAREFPDRFFNFGIAEQNMMACAAGLAAAGKIVIASTFAVFATGRCWDQVRQSIAYPRLNVKIVASHAGITVGGDGASHQTLEDIGLMRVMPNMTIVVPADAIETEKALRAIVRHEGPVYMRLGRMDVPTVCNKNHKFRIGRSTVLRKGEDCTIFATGQLVAAALRAAEDLERTYINAAVVNMSTIKPIDREAIIYAAKKTGAIVTAEEHSVINGLGSAVAEVLVENDAVPMKRVGVKDMFGESGESTELMVKYGLTAEGIVNAAYNVINRKKR
jgi:transketolase